MSIVVAMTAISIALSVAITWSFNKFVKAGPLGEGMVIAVLAPLLIAPVMSVQMLRLLHQLDQAEQQLQLLSHTDELTQTFNRRYFMQYINQEFKRAERYGETFSIAIVDLDNFKQINDQWGHLAGDEVLRMLTRMFRASIREADVCARYGGDEFIFLFPRTNRQQTEIWVRRVYEMFETTTIEVDNHEIRPMFSMGIAVFDPTFDNFDELLKQADNALYQAKGKGGNQYVLS